MYGLNEQPIREQIELVEHHPSKLADMLKNDQLDLGLVPVAILPDLDNYHIVGKHCIGTEGEAASVCLFSEVPLAQIERVYLDYQSRTSVALLLWIMRDYWGIRPEIMQAFGEDYRKEIKGTTAGLVIGDRAFEQRKISTFFYDLGSEWRSITGLPFVFAAWVSKKKLPDEFILQFDDANALGLAHIDEIVRNNPYSLYDLGKYYKLHMNYQLDERKLRALNYFLELIKDVKLEDRITA